MLGTESEPSPTAVLERLRGGDQPARSRCASGFLRARLSHSESPVHPDRTLRGREQMRKNCSQICGTVPDKILPFHHPRMRGAR
jgi:hypothetical protein